MKLYGYWRSSSSYRVRIALNLKNLDAQQIPINLREAEHRQSNFRQINAAEFVPVLELPDGTRLNQSLAIMHYLDRAFPAYPLLPVDTIMRARCEAFALSISSEIQPLQNLRVLKYLRNDLKVSDADVQTWTAHWITDGFQVLEAQAQNRETRFLFGDQPGLAECCLIPQIYNARRFGINMQDYPTLKSVEDRCAEIDAFERARPEHQADAPA